MMSSSTVYSINSREASEILLKEPSAIFIDVRSHMEFLFIGHPVGALNIPWIDEPDWNINPKFVPEVRQLILGGLPHESGVEGTPILLICRSGKRSLEAGNMLIENKFRGIYNIEEGFEGELNDQHHRSTLGGWRFEGLPWEQC